MHQLTIAALTTFMFASSSALAADPVTAGSANIGTPPGYSGYQGFWKTGAQYSLLTDGTNTYLNAPSQSGNLYFRFQNTNVMTLGYYSLGIDATTTFTREVYANAALQAKGPSGMWTGYFQGVDLGLVGIGTLYGVYSSGPLYGTTTLTLGGQAYKPGGGSFVATSDLRVKKDITDFRLGLAELEQVRPVRFKYNGLAETDNSGKEYVGVIAQEIEPALPFLVTSIKRKLRKDDTDATEVKQVDPSAFTYMLVNAVQELSKQNKQMRRMICQDHPRDPFCTALKTSATVAGAEKAMGALN